MEAHAAEDERSQFARLSLAGCRHRELKVAVAELEVVQVHEPQGPGEHGRLPGRGNEPLAQRQGLRSLQQLGDGLELAFGLRKQGVDRELPIRPSMGGSDRLHVADRGEIDPAWLLQRPDKPVTGFGAASAQPFGEG
jgi:hypothetical protein